MSERLLWVVAGSVSAAFVPYHLTSLQQNRPDVELRMVLTRTATQFVSRTALLALSSDKVWVDEWDTLGVGHSPHVEWSQWADAVLVYPATFGFVTRFASGNADTPAMLALQLSGAPTVLAPALPPGADRSPAYRAALDALHRPNVTVLPPSAALSTHTGRRDAHAPAPFASAVDLALGGPGPGSPDEWPTRGIIGHAANLHVSLTIRDLGSGFVVERITADDEPTDRVLAPLSGKSTTVRWPSPFRHGTLAFTAGPAAASRWLTSGIPEQVDAAVEALVGAVEDLDSLLAALPDRVPGISHCGTPAPLVRLAQHLEDPAIGDAAGAAEFFGPHWRSQLRELLGSPSESTPCFGDFGLGTLFPVPAGRPADLLCGLNLGVAAPGHDRGMLLGELAELRRSTPVLMAHERLGELMDELTAPGTGDLEATVRTAVARMALHLLDFVRYDTHDRESHDISDTESHDISDTLADKWVHLRQVTAAVRRDPVAAARLLSRGVPSGST